MEQDGDLCNQGSALGASLVEAVPGERGGHKVSVYSDSRAQPLAVELVEVSQRTTLYPPPGHGQGICLQWAGQNHGH
jgi:hypothetical protein